ncbi:MAG TPA: DUF4389 domain-containing protein [Acidimicrobiales bacterium]
MEAALGGPSYPAELTITSPERIARWRPFVHWLLVIPHALIVYALNILSQVVAIVSWFVILFTGRLPESLAGVQAMCLRYSERASAYATVLLEEYPPFSFDTTEADPRDYPGILTDFEPELEGRNRLTTFFRWVLAIPHFIVLAVLGFASGIAWIIGMIAIVVTGAWPEGLQRFVVGVMRWSLRVMAYTALLTDEYPPFSLEP